MGRVSEYRDLEPRERRIAMMRAGGASATAIGMVLEIAQQTVREVLSRPRVGRAIMTLQGMVVDEVEDGVELLNSVIKATANRAFEIERTNMEDLHVMGREAEEPHVAIRAKLGAVATAQDILDRAGNRAPTKIISTNLNANISPADLEHLAEVLKESRAIDVTQQGRGEEGGARPAGPSEGERREGGALGGGELEVVEEFTTKLLGKAEAPCPD